MYLAGGDDSFSFVDNPTAGKRLEAASLTIQPSAGTDSVVIDEDLKLTGNLTVDAESITIKEDYTDPSQWHRIGAGQPDLVRIANDYPESKGKRGAVYRYLGDADSIDLGNQDYIGNTDNWQEITRETADYIPKIGNISPAKASATGGIVMRNDVRSDVYAYIEKATVNAGAVEIKAIENAVIHAGAESTSKSVGGSAWGSEAPTASNGVLAVNAVLSHAFAYLKGTTVTTTATGTSGDMILDAQNNSIIDATVQNSTISGEATGVMMALNLIGWDPGNLLFDKLTDKVGDKLGTKNEAQVRSYVEDSTINAAGKVSVTAALNAQINATVTNAADSTASSLFKATGSATSGILANNIIASSTQAYITDTAVPRTRTVHAGGALTVKATDDAGIYANSRMVSSSMTTNDGGAALLQRFINEGRPADYTTSDGPTQIVFTKVVRLAEDYNQAKFITGAIQGANVKAVKTSDIIRLDKNYADSHLTTDFGNRLIEPGDNVKIAEGFDAARGVAGAVYQYLGASGRIALGEQNYTDS